MSLIKCSECEKEMSSNALVCPHCGAPNKEAQTKEAQKKSNGVTSIVFSVIGLCIILFGEYIGMSDLSKYGMGFAMFIPAIIIEIANKKQK